MDYPIRTVDQLRPVMKAYRNQEGLSQHELAAKVGVTQQALSLLEAAPHRASFERLFAVCAVLGVEIVLRDKESPKPPPTDGW